MSSLLSVVFMVVRNDLICFVFSVGNAELLRLFGHLVSPYMQAMHFWFAVGGIVSPLVTAPFLTGEHCDLSNITTSSGPTVYVGTDHFHLYVHNYSNSEMKNNTESTILTTTICGPEDSNIFIPFTLSGIIAISSSVSFLALYNQSKKRLKTTRSQTEIQRNERLLKLSTKIMILSTISAIFLLYTAMEDIVGAYVATFSVEQMNMTKTEASYVTATLCLITS